MTRFSRTGSSFPKTAAERRIEMKKQNSLLTLQIIDERHDLVRHDLGRHRADLLVADHAALVDHVGLGHAVDAVVDADLAVGVVERAAVRVAVALEPLHAVLAAGLGVEAVPRRGTAVREADEHRMLVAAADAPGRPDLEPPHPAAPALPRRGAFRTVP